MTGQVHLELYIAQTGTYWNTLPQSRKKERRDWKAEKREKKGRTPARMGSKPGTHRERVITKCTGSDRNERIR